MTIEINKYSQALAGLIKGQRHSQILGIANLGFIEGLTAEQIISDIKLRAPDMPLSEIRQAVNRAAKDFNTRPVTSSFIPWSEQTKPKVDWIALRNSFIEKGYDGLKEKSLIFCELWESSKIRLYNSPEDDSKLVLETLYQPEEYLFIGDTFSTDVKTVREWLSDSKLSNHPHVIWNPLSGQSGLTKEGKESFRADSCIKSFRYAVAEFDSISKEDQAALWLYLIREKSYPVTCLVDSGGKSIHAIIAVNCKDVTEWELEIEGKLFTDFLIPLGCDRACKNEARLSRLPGHFRSEKNSFQRLLYLNPEAGRAA